MNAPMHTMKYYREQERIAFSKIPGVERILVSHPSEKETISAMFPDAAFALMVADNLLGLDREQCAIHQTAYFSILNGESIADVRFRYDSAMRQYVERHMWDD